MNKWRAVPVVVAVALLALAGSATWAQQLPPPGSPGLRFLGFSTNLPPSGALLVRQAIASAIDRDAVMKTIAEIADDPGPAHALIPPGVPGYSGDMRGYPFDPAAAKNYWGQLPGTSRPTSLSISVRIPDDPTATATERRLMAAFNDAVRDSLARTLGITVILKPENPSDLFTQIRNQTVPIYMLAFIAGPTSFQRAGNFALTMAKTFTKDPDVLAAADAEDALKAEMLSIKGKALLVPIIHYKFK